jgi:serine/threonine protein kinase
MTFESNLHLKRIESWAFLDSFLEFILISSIILFIRSNAVDTGSCGAFIEGDSCRELYRWLQLRKKGITVDFRRIERVGSGLPSLEDYLVNLSEFAEGSIIDEPSQLSNEICCRTGDGFLIIVKSISLSESVEKSQIVNELENLINLHHPCIAAPIGFLVSSESVCWEELKIVRLYSEGCSLAEILSVRQMWWTSTVKAKVIVAIGLAFRFVQSLVWIHGYSTTNNIVLDSDHEIHIVDFKPVRLEICEGESESEEGAKFGRFSREGWTSRMDVCAFALIRFEIVLADRHKMKDSFPRAFQILFGRYSN